MFKIGHCIRRASKRLRLLKRDGILVDSCPDREIRARFRQNYESLHIVADCGLVSGCPVFKPVVDEGSPNGATAFWTAALCAALLGPGGEDGVSSRPGLGWMGNLGRVPAQGWGVRGRARRSP